MIETERLLLREYTWQDLDAIYEILSDPETMRHYPKPFDEAQTRNWIAWNLHNYEEYGFGLWAAIGMKKVKEYPDEKNGISYAYAMTRKEWEEGKQVLPVCAAGHIAIRQGEDHGTFQQIQKQG